MPHLDPPTSDQLRTYLAADRTLLAWVRTGLAMMGFGFIVARFGLFLRELATVQQIPAAQSPHLSLWIGTVLIVLGVAVCAISAAQHIRFSTRFRRGDPLVLPSSFLAIAVSVALSILGLVMATYLIWIAY